MEGEISAYEGNNMDINYKAESQELQIKLKLKKIQITQRAVLCRAPEGTWRKK